MTSYGPYDAGLPCKNANCKSHGSSHPNCKCYPGMASGGEVRHFCDEQRPHEKGCKYYAEGGGVGFLEATPHSDPEASVAAYLGLGGLHGLLNMPSNNDEESLANYNHDINRGHKHIDSRVGSLFGGKPFEKKDHTKSRKQIHEWMEKGGIDHDIQQEIYKENEAQQFAKGGSVETPKRLDDKHIANAYPDQNVMLQAAKGRMSNYLNSLRPLKEAPKLAFDMAPNDHKQKKSYERAVKLAADPLRIVDKIKSGMITPEHVTHFKNLYPEVDQALQKKITEKITKAQLKGERPQHHVRQGLSLLMGAPLSGDMLPQNIIAAQATFQAKKQEQPPPQKKTSALKEADDSLMTANQAAASRQQKQ